MEHDLNRLTGITDQIDSVIGILSQLQQMLNNAIHKPGFTSQIEFALVQVNLEAIHQQLEAAIQHYKQLIEVAEKIGED